MRPAKLVLTALFATSAAAQLPPPLPPLPVPVSAAQLPQQVPQLDVSFPYGIPLPDFARVVLQDVLRSPFIFSPDFVVVTDRVGFNATDLKKHGSEQLLRDVLAERGFVLEKAGGYYRVTKKKPVDESKKEPAKSDFLYRLRYRDAAYLSSTLTPLFPQGSFTFQRGGGSVGTGSSFGSAGTTGQVTGGGSTGSSSRSSAPVDTGTSAFSQSSRDDLDVFVFRGTADEIKRLKALLAQLDVPVPRVLARAFVLEVNSSKGSGFSVAAVTDMLTAKLGLSITGDTLANALSFRAGSFSAVLSAFSNDSAFRILTAPSVYVDTGESAVLSVGTSVPTLGAIQQNGNGQSSQSIQYRDTGVILKLTPRVFDDVISLLVSQELSDAIETTTGVKGTPTLTKRSLQTSLNVASGDWVVLGGLTGNKTSSNANLIPWTSLKIGSQDSSAAVDIVILLYVERVDVASSDYVKIQ